MQNVDNQKAIVSGQERGSTRRYKIIDVGT